MTALERAFAALTRAEARGWFWTVRSSQLLDRADPNRIYIADLRLIANGRVVREKPFRRSSVAEVVEAAAAWIETEAFA